MASQEIQGTSTNNSDPEIESNGVKRRRVEILPSEEMSGYHGYNQLVNRFNNSEVGLLETVIESSNTVSLYREHIPELTVLKTIKVDRPFLKDNKKAGTITRENADGQDFYFYVNQLVEAQAYDVKKLEEYAAIEIGEQTFFRDLLKIYNELPCECEDSKACEHSPFKVFKHKVAGQTHEFLYQLHSDYNRFISYAYIDKDGLQYFEIPDTFTATAPKTVKNAILNRTLDPYESHWMVLNAQYDRFAKFNKRLNNVYLNYRIYRADDLQAMVDESIVISKIPSDKTPEIGVEELLKRAMRNYHREIKHNKTSIELNKRKAAQN